MEYYNEDLLYKYFKETIKSDSTKKMERLRKEIDTIKERELRRIDLQVKRQIDWTIGLELADLKKEHQTKINQISIDNDIKLMAHRAELLGSIFAEVEKKIKKFSLTKQFKDYIISKIDLVNKTYKASCTKFIIGKNDINLSDIIQSLNKNNKVEFSKNIKIGGFIAVLSDGIEIDETFDSKINDKVDDFILESKLFIKK